MAWQTTLSNGIITQSRTVREYAFNPIAGVWTVQYRTKTTNTIEYPGINQANGPALAASVVGGAGVEDAYYQYGSGGSGSVVVTTITYGSWVTPT